MNQLFHNYFTLIKKWGRSINLTSIKSEDEFYSKHVEDSLSLIPHIGSAKRVLDLGTGAGIPGIILKMERPDVEVMLIDATRKKIAFCDEVIRQLDLKGIVALWARAEDPAVARSVGRFDLVVSRATWALPKYLEMALPYMADDGRCIAMKGPKWPDELKAAAKQLKSCSLALDGTHPYKLRNGDSRCLLVFRTQGCHCER